MRKLSIGILLVVAGSLAAQILQPIIGGGKQCCTFFVDTSGNDSCDGTSPTLGSSGHCAWATVAKVNGTTLTEGQSVGFKRGGTWRETLTPGQSGAVGSPITFTAYGAGAAPIIDGANALTSWTQGTGSLPQEACTSPCIFDSGFETGGSTFTDWTSRLTNGGTVTQSTAQVAHGTYSMALTSGSGTDSRMAVTKSISALVAGTPMYYRFYVYIPTGSMTASESAGFFLWGFSDNSASLSLSTNSSGNVSGMQLYAGTCAPCTTGVTFAMDTWHRIDIEFLVGTTTGNGGGELWLDGNVVGSAFNANTTGFTSKTAINVGNGNYGAFVNAGHALYIDDFRESTTGPIGAFSAAGVPTNVWYSTVASCPAAAFVNGVASLPQVGYGSLSANQWYCTGTTFYSYGPGSPTNVEVPVRNYNIDTNGENYITTTGLALTQSLIGNFYCDGSTNCVVSNNTISNAVWNGYLANGTTGSNTVSGNLIPNAGQHAIASQNGGGNTDNGGNKYLNNTASGCDWAMLNVNGGECFVTGASNDTFAYNRITNMVMLGTSGSNDGISVGFGAKLTGISIHDNTITNIPYGNGIWCGECSGNIYNNTVTNSNLDGILLWGYLTTQKTQNVYNNILIANNSGFQIGGSNTTYYTVLLANNDFVNNTNSIGGWNDDIYVQANLTGLTAKNNIFYSPGATAPSHQAWNLGTQSAASIDYNIYQTSGLIKYAGSAVTWATWQGDGFDAHGQNATDPLFANVGAGDFTLQPGSPAIGAGVYIPGVSTANPPNIGAK